jgi:hypothetical protein
MRHDLPTFALSLRLDAALRRWSDSPTVLTAMALPHLVAAYQAVVAYFPAITLLSQNLLITGYFLFFLFP